MSCGDDCRVKFWDVRKPTECLKILSDHSHWYYYNISSPNLSSFLKGLVITLQSFSRSTYCYIE